MNNQDLISREALHKTIGKIVYHHGYFSLRDIKEAIDNAPAISPEITEEQAIDKLRETGWLQQHDKELTPKQDPERLCSTCTFYDEVSGSPYCSHAGDFTAGVTKCKCYMAL